MIAIPGDTRTLAEREAEYDAFVAANLRRNFIAHFFHGMLGMTGFRLIYAPTFMPTYIHRLTGSRSDSVRTTAPCAPNPRAIAAKSVVGNRAIAGEKSNGPKWWTSAL